MIKIRHGISFDERTAAASAQFGVRSSDGCTNSEGLK